MGTVTQLSNRRESSPFIISGSSFASLRTFSTNEKWSEADAGFLEPTSLTFFYGSCCYRRDMRGFPSDNSTFPVAGVTDCGVVASGDCAGF